jgi:hypothetical protein
MKNVPKHDLEKKFNFFRYLGFFYYEVGGWKTKTLRSTVDESMHKGIYIDDVYAFFRRYYTYYSV